MPLASRSLALDMVAAGPRLVAVGERGHVLISGDSGGSWVQSEVPTRAMLTGVHFHDERLGWGVGHDAIILRTRDGGRHWERVHYEPGEEAPLLDVWFQDATHGIAVGAYGLMLVSSDGGAHWSRAEFRPRPLATPRPDASPDEPDDDLGEPYDFHLNAIENAGGGRLYIAAEAGRLYRSQDNGGSWVELPSPYRGSFFGILALGGDALLAYGLRGHLFRSEDAGVSWAAVTSGTEEMLTDALRLRDGTVVVAGLGGAVLVSHDGGRRFVLHAQAHRLGNSAIVQAQDGTVTAAGESGLRRLPASLFADSGP
jgi:photosystem II stability/assembly factor-like uncharacterized protein